MSLAILSKEDNLGFNSRLLPPSEHEMMVYQAVAKNAAASKLYQGDESTIMMKMLAGREFGIPPMQSINGGIHVIQGKVEMSARMMSALIRRARHKIIVKENTGKICTLIGVRADTGETLTCSYTFEEAKLACLVKPGGGWVKCQTDMTFARALSRLARQLFIDIIGIGYIEGEISQLDSNLEGITKDQELEVVWETPTQMSMEEFLNQWGEMKDQFLDYMNHCMRVMGWDVAHAINTFNGDLDRTKSKFHEWLDKKQKKISA
jgi:hypothetical protein